MFLDSQNLIVVLRLSCFSDFLSRGSRANRRAAGTPLLVRRPLYGNAAVDKVEERALVRRVAKEQRRAHG